MPRRQFAVAALGLSLVLSGALVPLSSQAEAPAIGGTYAEAVVGRPRYLNPLLAETDDPDSDVVALAFSGLTRLTPAGEVAPDLARDWTVSPDGLTYVFRLRTDVLWHDGKPFTPDDVLFTIRAAQDPEFRGSAALAGFWRAVAVDKPDQERVRFTLKQPFAPFPEYASLGILPAHLLASVPASALPESAFNAHPVGTGPFRVVEASLQEIALEPNPTYYGLPPFLAGVRFRYYQDAPAALAAFRQGEVLGLRSVPAEELSDLAAAGGVELQTRPDASKLTLLVYNVRRPPFAEQSVRLAVALAIDRQRVGQAALGGQAAPATGPVSSTSWAFDARSPRRGDASAPSLDYQPARARELLDAAGWLAVPGEPVRQRAGQPLEFVLLTNDQPERVRAAEEISRELAAVGVRAQVQAPGWTGLIQDFMVLGRFQAALTAEWSPGSDPDLYAFWHSSQIGDGLNLGGWSNPRADELLGQARRTSSQAERARLYGQFQDLFAEEAPGVPLYHPLYSFAVARRVKGVEVGLFLRPADRLAGILDWYIRTTRAPRAL